MIDYSKLINKTIQLVKPSGIRKYFDIAAEMDDVISLGVGEPDFKTPWHIREAAIQSLNEGKTRYTSNSGILELREEICKYYERRFGVSGYNYRTDCLISVGGSEAIDLGVRCLINPGDEVLIPEPSFVCYTPIVAMSGGVPVPIRTVVENDFRLTADELRAAITPKTKLLILPYPNNPTGGIMRKEHLEEIAQVLRGTDIMILSDEIYAELTYGGISHSSIAAVDGMFERTVIVSGFSKAYSMTGWRLGYALGPSQVIAAMTKLHQYAIMSAPTNSQYAAIEALRNGDEDVQDMLREYDARRRFIVDGFNKLGLTCFEPNGAFYVFPCINSSGLTSDEFCEKLLYSKKVAVVPGNAFGDCGEGFIRVSYCYSISHIKEALKRIGEFLEECKG